MFFYAKLFNTEPNKISFYLYECRMAYGCLHVQCGQNMAGDIRMKHNWIDEEVFDTF